MKLKKETEAGRAVHGKWYGDACGAAFAMELIGERWSIPVIREMMLGARRFGEIRAALPGLSAKTLTERLDTLEGLGVVRRTVLPRPASAQVYALTEWGLGLEPVLQELGRWAVRSPLHDPSLPMTPVAFLLSLRTMIDAERAAGMDLWIGFDFGAQHFAGRLRGGMLAVHPAGEALSAPDLRFTAPDATDYLPVFYGKHPAGQDGNRLSIEGDPAVAGQFLDLFGLPDKIGG